MHNFTEDKRTSSQMSLRLVSPSATMDLTISYTSSLLHTSHTPSHASTSSCRGTQANTQGRQSHGATGSLAGPIGFIQGSQAGETKTMLNESSGDSPCPANPIAAALLNRVDSTTTISTSLHGPSAITSEQ